MSDNQSKQKVTYTYEQRRVLVLKEAFQRDLNLFIKMLDDVPKDWTLTVISDGPVRELIVNVPAKKR